MNNKPQEVYNGATLKSLGTKHWVPILDDMGVPYENSNFLFQNIRPFQNEWCISVFLNSLSNKGPNFVEIIKNEKDFFYGKRMLLRIDAFHELSLKYDVHVTSHGYDIFKIPVIDTEVIYHEAMDADEAQKSLKLLVNDYVQVTSRASKKALAPTSQTDFSSKTSVQPGQEKPRYQPENTEGMKISQSGVDPMYTRVSALLQGDFIAYLYKRPELAVTPDVAEKISMLNQKFI